MNLKTIATLAAAVVASSAWAAGPADQKCGAGTCGKKEVSCKKGEPCDTQGKEAMKEASCSKKEASCSKKEATCAKK